MKFSKAMVAIVTAGAFGIFSQSSMAHAATVPSNVRGTWYQRAYYNHHEIIRTKLFAHSETVKQGHYKTQVVRKDLLVNNFKAKFRFKNGNYHTVTVHVVGMGDAPSFISSHLSINGKRHHVLLQAPQQGHTFYVLTHFKPAKFYHIQGTLKY